MGTLAGKFEDFARARRQLFFCCNLVTAVLMVGKGLIFHFTGVDSNIFSLKTKNRPGFVAVRLETIFKFAKKFPAVVNVKNVNCLISCQY